MFSSLLSDPVKNDITELVQRELASPNREGDAAATKALINHIRQGSGNIVAEVIIKNNFADVSPANQIKMMSVLNQCLQNCGAPFAIVLSTEKWCERFFKTCKTTASPQSRDAIILTCIGWYKTYHTGGHHRLLQRFAQSQTLGAPFKQLIRQYEENDRARRQSQSSTRRSMQNFDNVNDANPNQVLANEETFLLECQGDLASLEYALEHPQILQDDDVAKECKKHKLMCMKMLESGQHEAIEVELMTLLERFSDALELYEAMTGVDMGEGQAAKQRAMDEEMANPDSDDDEQQRQLRERGRPRQDPGAVMVQAQQQQQNLIERERDETKQLRQQLEELRHKHDELQNKYKDAKAKNREAVTALERYAARVDALEGGGGDGAAAAAAAGIGAGAGAALGGAAGAAGAADINHASISEEKLRSMRDDVQAIRKGLREIKEYDCADIRKESAYYTAQITSALGSIMKASEMDRAADQKALHWTQELYKKEMKLRKQYYNTIQELKGNIRVYCRVRPMIKKELDEGHTNVMTFPSTDELKFVDQAGRPKLFEFDEVYPPDAPQSKVFEDTSPLIDSVVDGFNVCIFAYGQTGSGKTYTMGGGEGESKGINARALERLFSIIEERKETEESTVSVSVLEIYCEQIRDLMRSKKEAANISYEVKQGGPHGTYVTNLTEVPVKSPKEIDKIMATAMSNRSEGTTNMNEHSSRSHMLLYIIVSTVNKQTNMQSYGKLSLVDLAGSERLDKSGAEGQMLKEAVAINKSLSSLGDVISGLAQNSKHIPFRNSVLTFLLQDSMAGQAKVLMFVCVSPASYNVSESGSSLLFASRARGVAFGQIKKNEAKEKK